MDGMEEGREKKKQEDASYRAWNVRPCRFQQQDCGLLAPVTASSPGINSETAELL